MTTYITFGTDHADIHPGLGARLDEGYFAVSLPGYPSWKELSVAQALIGTTYAFDYQQRPGKDRPDWYVAGEIARLTLINERLQKQIVEAVEATFAAAEGNSNDAEITALQEARDLLASIIDYTPMADRVIGEED
jgi:hypothetical protein